MSTLPVSQNKEILEKWRRTLNDDIVRSPCRPIEIPNVTLATRIFESLKKHAEIHPGKACIIDAFNNEKYLTHQQVHDQALSVAAFLRSNGFSEGDLATTVLPNCIEFPVIHLAVWAAGGVFVGSSPAYKHHETVYQLRDSGSSVVFTTEALLESVLSAVQECPKIKTVICLRCSASPLPEGVLDWRNALDIQPLEEITEVSMDAPSTIYYSSGTTGLSKGIVHTHYTIQYLVEVFKNHYSNEIYSVLYPRGIDWYQEFQIGTSGFFHIVGFGLLNWYLLVGSPVIAMERLEEALFISLIEKYKVRHLSITPPIFAFLAKDATGQAACLDSVQIIVCSSAPLSKELSDQFIEHHPSVRYIVQGYGMTEIGCSHLPLLLSEGADGSCGVLTAGYEQRIVVPGTVQSCKQGDCGELLIRGPGIMIGYNDRPAETRALMDEDGWARTGDIAYLDTNGCLHIVDRVKELIKVFYANQTLQVAPAELEGILLSNDKIRDAAIVGVPSEGGGELVRAFVVKADEDLTGAEVEAIVAENLAPFKQITGGVKFLNEIPRSLAGKILRRELKEKY